MQAGVVDRIGTDIRRVLAPNPSAMTGPGTNSYLVGHGAGVVLIDPGPDRPVHLEALLSALEPGESIGTIVVTHAHSDHSAGTCALVARTNAPVLAFGDAASGRSALMARLVAAGLQGGGEGIDTAFRPDRIVADNERIPCPGGALEVIHTPGHMGGHICLARDGVLFSGDHAMGWATSLVSPPDGDMGAYMASLRRLIARDWQLMLPGHGPEVSGEGAPNARLQALLDHRLQREAEILAALTAGPATARTLASVIYTTTPAPLLQAAARNVLAHLLDLTERSLVTTSDPTIPEARFALVENPS